MSRLMIFLATGLAGLPPFEDGAGAPVCNINNPQYVNSLAADPRYVNSLAGLEGIAGDDSDSQAVAALEGLSAEEVGRRHRNQGKSFGVMTRTQGGHHMAAPPPHQVGVTEMPLNNIVSAIPGAPARALRKVPLPLGSIAFTSTSGTELKFTAKTQRPYKPVRVIFVPARTGATSTGLLSISEMKVGQDTQPAADGDMPLEAFGTQVWDADLDLTPLTPGIEITIKAKVSVAPAAADRIDIGGVAFGYSVQS